MSTHLPPEPGSKPRGQFVRESVAFGIIVVVVVVVVAIAAVTRAVVIGDVRACGVGTRGIRSQRYEPRVFLH